MSDFYSGIWDWYVTVIVLVSVVGCAVFLKSQSKARIEVPDDAGEADSTGHVWDENLREFQHPLPRWWVITFYLTVAFALVYLVLYPGLGTRFKGALGWTSTGELQGDNRAAEAKFGPMFDAYLKEDLVKVAGDPRAHVMGERIFLNWCSQCHGSDARGAKGFPNLTDEEWIWGGDPATIEETITGGREGLMPPQIENFASKEDAADTADYVLSLSGSPHEPARAVRGKVKFDAICSACHGAEGKGTPAIGAPDISNRIWTYGGTRAAIVDAIEHGHHGVMPAHRDVLSPAQIHLVAAYVYSLSHPSFATPGGAASEGTSATAASSGAASPGAK